MDSEIPIEESFTPSDKQRYVERIAELELENSYLKAKCASSEMEVASLQEQISKLKSEPEFSAGFEESLKGL